MDHPPGRTPPPGNSKMAFTFELRPAEAATSPSIAEASALYGRLRDESGEGCNSTFPKPALRGPLVFAVRVRPPASRMRVQKEARASRSPLALSRSRANASPSDPSSRCTRRAPTTSRAMSSPRNTRCTQPAHRRVRRPASSAAAAGWSRGVRGASSSLARIVVTLPNAMHAATRPTPPDRADPRTDERPPPGRAPGAPPRRTARAPRRAPPQSRAHGCARRAGVSSCAVPRSRSRLRS